MPIPDGPWKDISTDFTTDLPISNGYDSILVVVDRFSKEGRFIPCNKDITAVETATLFKDHVWKLHGLPTMIVSDRGPQFAAKVMQELCKLLGIKSKLSTAFHPQTDGQTERLNRDLQQYLRLFVAEKQNDWSSWLSLAEFSYNNKRQESLGKTPFEVTRSYMPRMGVEPLTSKVPAAQEIANKIKETLDQARRNLEHAQEAMKRQADKSRSDAPEYKMEDLVWLSTTNLKLTRASKKLSEKWLGPYKVISMKGPNALFLRITLPMH